jgi:hypothetical protein
MVLDSLIGLFMESGDQRYGVIECIFLLGFGPLTILSLTENMKEIEIYGRRELFF